MCAANCFIPSMLNAKVLPALQDGVAEGSSGSDSTDSSSSSSSSSSDSEEEQGGVPNPALEAAEKSSELEPWRLELELRSESECGKMCALLCGRQFCTRGADICALEFSSERQYQFSVYSYLLQTCDSLSIITMGFPRCLSTTNLLSVSGFSMLLLLLACSHFGFSSSI